MENTIEITYNYTFDDNLKKSFTLSFDSNSLALISTHPVNPPDWTELSCHRCENCSLAEDATRHCPLALNLSSIVGEFKDFFSHQSAYVEVTTAERTYAKATTIQEGLSAMLGIVMTTSGCPIMEPLKPMVRFHLPFATMEETYYRMISTWLMAQLFIFRKGEAPDLSLAGIKKVYANVTEVNRCIAERLRNYTAAKDANINALVNLDFFSAMASMAIEDVLTQLEPNYSGYL
jgi:hypothetical protein